MTQRPANPALVHPRKRRFLDRVRAEIAPNIAPGRLGLAVSGGGDSMAMLLALHSLAPDFGWDVSVATVDHGLRPEAADEVRLVARVCADRGIPHQTLHWTPPASDTSGNLMQAAASARYGLLAAWAQDLGRVAVAHTADDQAESVLMGLARSAGLDGLAGLRPAWSLGEVRFLRPFLGVTRADMQGYLAACGQVWAEDPTNLNLAFDRPKARKALAALRDIGITPEGLARVARNLAAVQADLRKMLAEVAGSVVVPQAGALRFARAGFAALPDELARRLLRAGVMWLSSSPHAPREPGLARLGAALRGGSAATLAGCRLIHRAGAAYLVREVRAVGPAVPLGAVWDGRWQVTGAGEGQVRALGSVGLAQVPDWRAAGLPRDVALVTPGVWHGDRLISAPVLGFGKDHAATLTAAFGLFLLSH